ncbi:MAG: hypothetical protein JWP89_4347 [Schlesneria sp.]|nr:hypothetical protein [Schlesneria sp.]
MKTPTADRRSQPRLLFHPHAYVFVSEALKTAQESVNRQLVADRLDETHHISGPELLEGVRVLGLRLYGPMAPVVFRHWGLVSTGDFGRIVFEMIDRGEMRKSESDQLSDFQDVYAIDDSFANEYKIDVAKVFKAS